MTIWNVSPIYYGDNNVRYSVLPHNLKGVGEVNNKILNGDEIGIQSKKG